MFILVTGGGGFLGRYVVEQLLDRGHRVRVFSRGAYPHLESRDCECMRGDLRTATHVQAACRDIDMVIHVAALAGVWGRYEEFRSINVVGTNNLIDACRATGVKKMVYTSSPSVVFGMRDLCGVDERQPYPRRFYAHYPATKAAAEMAVLRANDGRSLATCALRPHLIWGPRDTHIVPGILDRARRGRLIQIGDGSNLVDVTYVEHAADAHVLAAERLSFDSPLAGQAYFIGDAAPVKLWEWIGQLLRCAGLPPVTRRISYPLASTMATAMECLYTLLPLPGEPRLTRFLAAQFARSHYFDHGKAERDLSYRPTVTPEAAMQRTLEWIKGIDD